MADDSGFVWDALSLDLFVQVAQMTVLSPLFAIWVPLLMLTMVRRLFLSAEIVLPRQN